MTKETPNPKKRQSVPKITTKEIPVTQATVLKSTSDVVDIPLSLIVADAKKNSRSFLPNVPELATSIKNEGQQSPVLVSKRKDGKFDLIWGYRRFAAVSLLAKDAKSDKDKETYGVIRATVREEEMTERDRVLANLIENLAREDLTTFDMARSMSGLRDMFPEGNKEHMSGAKIANNVGKSAPYVNNLLRSWDTLPDVIKDRWERECAPDWDEKSSGAKKVLTPDMLNKLAKASLTDEERMDLYNELIGKKSADSDAGEGREPRQPNPALVKRPGKKQLEDALAAAEEIKGKASAQKGQDQKVEKLNGVIQALKFALGTNTTIPGVYTPPDPEDDGEE